MRDVFRLHVERLEGLDGIFSIAMQAKVSRFGQVVVWCDIGRNVERNVSGGVWCDGMPLEITRGGSERGNHSGAAR